MRFSAPVVARRRLRAGDGGRSRASRPGRSTRHIAARGGRRLRHAAALAIAIIARIWRWSGWSTAGAAVLAFIVLGVVLAVPAPWSRRPAAGPSATSRSARSPDGRIWSRSICRSGCTATCWSPRCRLPRRHAVHACSWRGAPAAPVRWRWFRRWRWCSFGLVFGSASTSEPIAVGNHDRGAPRELAIGIAGDAAVAHWLAWRAQAERHARCAGRRRTSGVRDLAAFGLGPPPRGAGRRHDRRRRGGAAVAAPAVAEGRTRDVLRSAAGPEIAISQALSPLSSYRAAFTDDAFDGVLFRVEAVDGALPERIRIAHPVGLRRWRSSAWRTRMPASGTRASSGCRPARDGGRGRERHRAHQRSRVSAASGCRRSVRWRRSLSRGRMPRSSRMRSTTTAPPARVSRRAGGGVRAGQSYVVSAMVARGAALREPRRAGRDRATVELPGEPHDVDGRTGSGCRRCRAGGAGRRDCASAGT